MIFEHRNYTSSNHVSNNLPVPRVDAVYAARWTREGTRAVEYLLVPERFAFGRCWTETEMTLEGYWFNSKHESVAEIQGKLAFAHERWLVSLDVITLAKIVGKGQERSVRYYIRDVGYCALVKKLFDESRSIFTELTDV